MPRSPGTLAVSAVSVAINLFVIADRARRLVSFPFGAVDSDMYVLALPMEGNSPWLSVASVVGGLSAATAW